MNELNKKLAEWAGIRYEPDQDEFKVIFPDGSWYNFGHDWEMDKIEPDFTDSLDACFKWLVDDVLLMLNKRHRYALWESAWTRLFDDWRNNMHAGREPALALCLAIEKLIDGH